MNVKKICSVIFAGLLVSSMSITAFAESGATLPEDTTSITQPTVLLESGVWSLSENDEVSAYLVFDTPTSGRLIRADGTGGVPFECEPNGYEIIFHLGGIDDTTVVTFEEGDARCTFVYADNTTVTYDVAYLEGADPATFDVGTGDAASADTPMDQTESDAYLDEDDVLPTGFENIDMSTLMEGDMTRQDTGLSVSGDAILAASKSFDFTLYIKLASAEAFSVNAHVKLVTGGEKVYTIMGSGKNAESWFPMQDMLNALHLTADEVAGIELEETNQVVSVSFTNVNSNTDWGKTDGKDGNPATGVGLALVPMALAGCSAYLFKKRK